jgi:hypothetical protein
LGQEVVGVVVAPKEHYTLVTLPQHGTALAYISKTDFNTGGAAAAAAAAAAAGGDEADEAAAAAASSWPVGSQLQCRVAALPTESNGWRLLLQVRRETIFLFSLSWQLHSHGTLIFVSN